MTAPGRLLSRDASQEPMQHCPSCGRAYGLDDPRWRCDCAGEPLRLTLGKGLEPAEVDTSTRSLWRYRGALRVPESAKVTLGEGGTPLLALNWYGRLAHLKLDTLMPTGSFKDRGSALVMSHMRRCGVPGLVEDSSGNAGASYAAYAATAGLRCTVFAPATATPGKLHQVTIYGGRLQAVDASRDETARIAQEGQGADIYGGHNWQPFFIEGTKTLAYELWEDFGWQAPDVVIVPLGGGSNLLGLDMGFRELLACGSINRLPRLYGVQASACAPLADAFAAGGDEAGSVAGGATIAEGIALRQPPRAREVLSAVRRCGGEILAADDDETIDALRALARRGVLVEPTAATSLAGYRRLTERGAIAASERTVVVLTGSGLKAVARIHELIDSAHGECRERARQTARR